MTRLVRVFRHYAGDQETYVEGANVSCSVYPSDPQRAKQQIERVRRALVAVLGGRP